MEEERPPGRTEEEKARRAWLAEKGRLVWQAAAIRKANSLDDDTAAALGRKSWTRLTGASAISLILIYWKK